MRRFLPAFLFLSVPIGAFTTAASAADSARDTKSDTWIESQLVTTYSLNQNLNEFEIDARVKDGNAVLTGAVEENADRELAERIARAIEGVKDVDNEIMVKDNARVPGNPGTQRSFTQSVADATITARVKSKLLWNSQTDGLDINVDTNKAVVSLQGRADSEDSKTLAGRLASNTAGVEEVQNKLVVDPQVRASMARTETSGRTETAGTTESAARGPNDSLLGKVDLDKAQDNAGAAMRESGKILSDGWVSAKIKSALGYTRGVDASDINVDVQAGAVTLTGTAGSDSERKLAEELAKDIRGVKSVKNNITVPMS